MKEILINAYLYLQMITKYEVRNSTFWLESNSDTRVKDHVSLSSALRRATNPVYIPSGPLGLFENLLEASRTFQMINLAVSGEKYQRFQNPKVRIENCLMNLPRKNERVFGKLTMSQNQEEIISEYRSQSLVWLRSTSAICLKTFAIPLLDASLTDMRFLAFAHMHVGEVARNFQEFRPSIK